MSLNVTLEEMKWTEVFSSNITHNLASMAKEAGLYEVLWRPEELSKLNVVGAVHLIKPLQDGLARLRASPDKFQALNPSNGWGDYEGLVKVTEDYLRACEAHPGALVRVSR